MSRGRLQHSVTAIRTKPFAILAGVSGTGKSKLPDLVARFSGGLAQLIPVRPDWTDSSEVLGYVDLENKFRPGPLLEFIKQANKRLDTLHVCIIDEMNLARVEQYFAEILSCIENRHSSKNGGFESSVVLGQKELKGEDEEWSKLTLPPNLIIVGTVNMDESAHGFSRKVLDRAFTLELSDVLLDRWIKRNIDEAMKNEKWPIEAWYPKAIKLGDLDDLSPTQKNQVQEMIADLIQINKMLIHAQLQIGYRTRDEIILFVLNSSDLRDYFTTTNQTIENPFDLAVLMKILPRIVGGSSAIRAVIHALLGWSYNRTITAGESDAEAYLKNWYEAGRPGAMLDASLPRTAARLCLMCSRFRDEGFTSFWL